MKKVTDAAAQLSITEVGLGSVLHGLHVPFGGHLLSINQAMILCKLSSTAEDRVQACRQSVEVSSVSAILKSLAPMGNTFGPMLSICVQGILYATGTLIGGKRVFGQVLGITFLCVWGFLQPLLTYGLIFGPRLIKDFQSFFSYLAERWSLSEDAWIYFVLALFVAKLVIAFTVRFGVLSFPVPSVEKFLIEPKRDRSFRNIAIRPLFRPLFLFSLFLTVAFAYLSKSSPLVMAWIFLRPLALGILVFWVMRTPLTFQTLEKVFGKTVFGRRLLDLTKGALTKIEEKTALRWESAS